ncbi:hypothetical protein PENTCL1PPCAC_681, partial [Pristionchus entomophagus]
VIAFRFITSGVGVILLISMELKKKKFVAHKSLKTLLNLHGFWTFLLCFTTFIESSIQYYTHLTLKEPSDLLMTPSHCLVRMAPQFFAISGSVTSMLVMSFERCEASRNLSTYESSSSKSVNKFVALHVSFLSLGVFLDAVKYDFPTKVAHCSVGSVIGQNPQTALVGSFFLFSLFTIYFSSKLLRRNEYLHDSEEYLNMSLTERYQLCGNIRVLRLLLPIVVSHTSITMAGSVGHAYFVFGGYKKEYYPILEDTINMVYLQGIAMPLIFLYRYRNKRVMESQIVTMNKWRRTHLCA